MGVYGIFESSPNLNSVQCREAIEALRIHDKNREPFSDVEYRDHQWIEHTEGWWGHLVYEIVPGSWRNSSGPKSFLLRNQANLNLLRAELALRAFQLTHNSLPDRLDQLVPDILPEVPRDPFDPAGGPLRYKKTPDGYLLYSVSLNGPDDGGVPPDSLRNDPSDLRIWSDMDNGDLRLDLYFAEDEPDATQEADADFQDANSVGLPDK